MRRKDREVKDVNEIVHILDSCKVLHLGLSDKGKPYVVPMNYGYSLGKGLEFYLHCAKEGRKLEILRQNADCCVELECDTALKEHEIPCKNGYSFYSLMGFGKASFVEDSQQKIKYLKNLMKVQTGKDFDFTPEMVDSVEVICIKCEEYSAKHRI